MIHRWGLSPAGDVLPLSSARKEWPGNSLKTVSMTALSDARSISVTRLMRPLNPISIFLVIPSRRMPEASSAAFRAVTETLSGVVPFGHGERPGEIFFWEEFMAVTFISGGSGLWFCQNRPHLIRFRPEFHGLVPGMGQDYPETGFLYDNEKMKPYFPEGCKLCL